ncbi:hypothetical protein GDO81_029044 [Engystomops pustulosus]|uniref:Cytochrome P450 n=1 Tax=Engystomops pustulosus TaxID=76066 RepID=A0AAV6ZUW3_ENGPU|nr:hypothetical protein GDO81_029044 [Engystomops pustulosus]
MDLVIILICVAVVLFSVNAFKNQKHDNYKNFPPGPKPLPFIGNIHIMDIRKPHKTFMKLAKEYGPVFSVQFGMSKSIVLCGYNTLKNALMNHDELFLERPHTPLFSKATKGNGIVFATGENWKVMRKFTISTLRDYGTGKNTIEEKIIEESEHLVEKLRSYKGEYRSWKPFAGVSSINAAVTNIILYNCYPFLAKLLPGGHQNFLENVNEVYDFMRATFTEHKKELDVNDQRNLIDTFLAKQQEGKPESSQYYHNENLISLVSDLFAAGMESTAATLRWAILLMMKYPDIQEKVQSEMERVIGSAHPQMEHRKHMPYTYAVIHEILRFGDVAPVGLPHSASQDITFQGYFIPKGTSIIPVTHSALRDKDYFKKPEEFYPEHFLDSDGNFKKNEAFIPFSIGKRNCPGGSLAKMEIFLFFTSLLQNFTFRPPPGAELDLTPQLVGATNCPKSYEICAVPRR